MWKKMHTMMSCLLIAVAVLSANSVARAERPDDLLIIANNQVSVKSITTAELKRIYFKQVSQVGGSKVTPIHARKNSPLRAAFLQKVLGMSAAQEQSFWENEKIKSGAVEPSALDNTVRGVFSLKGSIGYCFRSDFKANTAKILLVL